MLAAGTAPAQQAEVLPDESVQQPQGPPPPHIELIDGVATVEHQGQSSRAAMSQPLIPGDRIKAENGRVEVMFADGSFLYLDHFTTVDFLDLTLMRLTAGRVTLIVKGQADSTAASAQYQVDTPAASVRTEVAGEYRIATLNGRAIPETELAVVRGAAQLASDAGAMMVRAGERSTAVDGAAPSPPYAFNSARFDAFDRWTASRQDAWLGSTSTRYLPQDVQMYSGAFDRYGAWGYDAQYGNIWYPTVAPTWRPYYNGYWDYYPGSYGWFWIGADPWAWPTHHFGRWGYARSRWFWIPGRRWGAAWVSWAISPTYIGWCPLGFDGRPVFGFFGGHSTYVSVGYDPWVAWTLIPRHSFGTRVFVSNYLVDGRRLGSFQRTGFVLQRAAPHGPAHLRTFAVDRGGRPQASPSSAFNRRFDRPLVDPRAGSVAGRSPRFSDNQRGAAVVGSAVPRGAPTRVEPDGRVPYGYVGGYSRSEESPYDRAARVAGERQPGTGRQPLRGDTSYESPYPPQYRSPVPEPYRPQSRSSAPEYGPPRTPYGYAVPRGSGRPDAGSTTVAPAPYAPAQPRSGVEAESRRGGPDRGGPAQAAPPSRGGERSASPRGGGEGGGGRPTAQPRAGGRRGGR